MCSAPFCFGQIRADLVLRQYLHLPLFQLRQAATFGGIGEEQPLRHRLLQAVVQQRVDAPYHASAETLILQLDVGICGDSCVLFVCTLSMTGKSTLYKRRGHFILSIEDGQS